MKNYNHYTCVKTEQAVSSYSFQYYYCYKQRVKLYIFFAGFLMSETRNESATKQDDKTAHSTQSSAIQINNESSFYDISLSSSVPICRICHCSSEEEELIRPCRCSGSVGHAHKSCIRKWIVSSTNAACELCNYEFRTKTKRTLHNIHKVTERRSFMRMVKEGEGRRGRGGGWGWITLDTS